MKNLQILRDLFSKVVIPKRADLQPQYYHKDFVLFANGNRQEYASYIAAHEELYRSDIAYEVRIDDDTLLESGDKAAMRVFITISTPKERAKEIEVVLIAQFKDGKIYRIWETTSPDWSKMESFSNYNLD